MKLGIALQYFTSAIPAELGSRIREAETIGYDSVWCGESYGSDAFTPLGYLASITDSIRLGTSIAQIPARPPTSAAMAAMTLDHLSKGRVVLGIGASGPQVAEGWYGQAFGNPMQRAREYVAILRLVFAREAPVIFEGSEYRLPLPGGKGLAKPLRSNLPVLRSNLPIHLGAEGPRNIALAAEIADGWHALFYSPLHDEWYRDALNEGFARRHGPADEFEVVATANVVIANDVEQAADRLRPLFALYVGGMGAPGANFHNNVFARRGWEAESAKIQELYLAGDRKAAIAAVPTRMIEEVALIGPVEKIRDEAAMWRDGVATTLAVVTDLNDLGRVADALAS
jgi:F420-dependent oxidoreductase-like protein